MCIDNLNDVNLRNCKEVEILGIQLIEIRISSHIITDKKALLYK